MGRAPPIIRGSAPVGGPCLTSINCLLVGRQF